MLWGAVKGKGQRWTKYFSAQGGRTDFDVARKSSSGQKAYKKKEMVLSGIIIADPDWSKDKT